MWESPIFTLQTVSRTRIVSTLVAMINFASRDNSFGRWNQQYPCSNLFSTFFFPLSEVSSCFAGYVSHEDQQEKKLIFFFVVVRKFSTFTNPTTNAHFFLFLFVFPNLSFDRSQSRLHDRMTNSLFNTGYQNNIFTKWTFFSKKKRRWSYFLSFL